MEKQTKETHEEWLNKMQKSLVDFESAPIKQELAKTMADIDNYHTEKAKEQTKEAWAIIGFIFLLIILIPILILLWNLHPVLGILGIIGYVFLIINKFK